MSYDAQRSFADSYNDAVRHALGAALLAPAPFDEDTQRATDFCTFDMRSKRVACRIREPRWFERYSRDFTIRSQVASGARTELHKIMDGWGDLMFYGFGNPDRTLRCWRLGDLDVFRTWFGAFCHGRGRCPGDEIPNGSGQRFRAFKWRAMPDDFVVDQGGDWRTNSEKNAAKQMDEMAAATNAVMGGWSDA